MSKPKKIAYHVKLTAQALNLSTYNDENIQKIFDIMLSTYQEYNLESKIKLKSEIQVAFHEYTSSLLSKASQAAEKISSSSSSSSTVLSLNQTIRNNYLGTTSKRQIPVDPSEVKQEISTSPSSVVTDIIPTGSDKSVNDSNSNNDVNIVTESTKPNINTQSDNNKTTEKTSKTSKRQKLSNENASSSSSTSSQVFTSLFSANISCPRPMNRLHDFAGLDSIIRQLKELVFFPVMYPEIYAHLGVQPSISILLQGPTGCGKTSLALAIAGELNLPFFKVSGPELIGGTSGESEERVRESFKAAATAAPSILFLDSLDVLASKKDSTQRGMDRRVIAQLCDSIDCITNLTNSDSPQPTSAQPIYDMSIAKDISVSSSSADLLMNNIYGKVNMKANKLVVLISATNK